MSKSVSRLIDANGGDFTNHDVAVISDWANEQKQRTPNPDWKRAYALIREGCDLLLRRRARSSVEEPISMENEPDTLNHQAYERGVRTDA